MRTSEEILDRIMERIGGDPLRFEVEEYVVFLDFTNASVYLDCSQEEWNKGYKEPTPENVMAKMQDYIDWAWRKADTARGISANRSIMHYLAWIWLAEEDEFLQQVQEEYDERYSGYGKPILRMIAEHFNLNASF